MKLGDWFVAGCIVWQTCATIAYCYQRQWREALVWGAYAVSNAAYLSLVRS